jgi:hypothetical protein
VSVMVCNGKLATYMYTSCQWFQLVGSSRSTAYLGNLAAGVCIHAGLDAEKSKEVVRGVMSGSAEGHSIYFYVNNRTTVPDPIWWGGIQRAAEKVSGMNPSERDRAVSDVLAGGGDNDRFVAELCIISQLPVAISDAARQLQLQ